MAVKNEIVTIDSTDAVTLYGVNNRILDRIRMHFPELKIIARGLDLMITGEEYSIGIFKERLKTAISTVKKGILLDDKEIDQLFAHNSFPDELESIARGLSDDNYNIVHGNEGRVIRAKTKNQRKLVDEYYKNDLLFAIGPAGTGKTYTAIALAVRALKNKEVRKLILTRPAVEAGERLGFLPGDLKDKLDPYLQPLYDALLDMIQPRKLQMLMEEGIIQIAPLAYMRGRTLDSAFVILDEAQNTSLGQLKMFLTRMGRNAKFIVTGDATQIDLPNKNDSGLLRGVELVRNIDGISVVNFGKEDIVRHPLVSKIIRAFESGAE